MDISRRHLLQIGTGVTAGLAGCNVFGSTEETDSVGDDTTTTIGYGGTPAEGSSSTAATTDSSTTVTATAVATATVTSSTASETETVPETATETPAQTEAPGETENQTSTATETEGDGATYSTSGYGMTNYGSGVR